MTGVREVTTELPYNPTSITYDATSSKQTSCLCFGREKKKEVKKGRTDYIDQHKLLSNQHLSMSNEIIVCGSFNHCFWMTTLWTKKKKWRLRRMKEGMVIYDVNI
jgi:hypothetical protein